MAQTGRLPGCAGSAVLEQSDDSMLARVEVAKAGIHKAFTTRNRLQTDRQIVMELVEGPFRQLQGVWSFTPLDEDACKVELALEFEFSSRLVELAFGHVFTELVNAMVRAFTLRAKEVYGG